MIYDKIYFLVVLVGAIATVGLALWALITTPKESE